MLIRKIRKMMNYKTDEDFTEKTVAKRDEVFLELSQENPWYEYELEKQRLSSQEREAEVKTIVENLKI